MKKYTVYFSLYGKKMKTTVFAENPDQARQSIRNQIAFHKVAEEKITNPITDFFKRFKK